MFKAGNHACEVISDTSAIGVVALLWRVSTVFIGGNN
jgi:hypothetical protein